jgi:hypothetical protein
MKPVRTHWILSREAPREDMMVGIAISIEVMPRATDNVPSETMRKTHHLKNGWGDGEDEEDGSILRSILLDPHGRQHANL